MKKITLALVALATAAAIAPNALAGNIPFTGGVSVTDSDDTWGPTGPLSITTTDGVSTVQPHLPGSSLFTQITNGSTAVVPSSIDISTNPDSLNEGDVLTFDSGAITFTLTGPIYISQFSDEYLTFSGTGVWSETGYINTPGTFTYDVSDTNSDYGVGQDGSSGGEWNISTTVTPEPSSLFLLGTGLLGLAAMVLVRKGKPAKNLVLKP